MSYTITGLQAINLTLVADLSDEYLDKVFLETGQWPKGTATYAYTSTELTPEQRTALLKYLGTKKDTLSAAKPSIRLRTPKIVAAYNGTPMLVWKDVEINDPDAFDPWSHIANTVVKHEELQARLPALIAEYEAEQERKRAEYQAEREQHAKQQAAEREAREAEAQQLAAEASVVNTDAKFVGNLYEKLATALRINVSGEDDWIAAVDNIPDGARSVDDCEAEFIVNEIEEYSPEIWGKLFVLYSAPYFQNGHVYALARVDDGKITEVVRGESDTQRGAWLLMRQTYHNLK